MFLNYFNRQRSYWEYKSTFSLSQRLELVLGLRHEKRSPRIRDTSPCRRWGVLVVSQSATQQAQVVEGQDQDHHAAESDAADPPANIQQISIKSAFEVFLFPASLSALNKVRSQADKITPKAVRA